MQITTDWLGRHFDLYNERYFGGGLPRPRLGLSNARTRLGVVTYKIHRERTGPRPSDVKKTYCNFCIRLSIYYEQTERDYQNTLLHEMIHYYIGVNGLQDDAPHGTLFRRYMDQLNRQGWNITVRKNAKLQPKAQKRAEPRLVLAIRMKSGECWFCVINPSHIRQIEARMRSHVPYESYGWYLANDFYFMDYAQSRTLRGHVVPSELFEQKIAQMTPFRT